MQIYLIISSSANSILRMLSITPTLINLYCHFIFTDCQVPIIKTPNLYKYIPLTDNGIAMGNPVRQSIRFKVKANNDAHVALMSSNNPNDPLYEIVLGGWYNTQSVIRDRKQGGHLAVYRGRVLNSNEFRTFTIKWSNARIRVEDESGKKLMEWTDTTNPYTIRNIGISTGWGSTGIWSFPCQGTYFCFIFKIEKNCAIVIVYVFVVYVFIVYVCKSVIIFLLRKTEIKAQ